MSRSDQKFQAIELKSECWGCPLINSLPVRESEFCFLLVLYIYQRYHNLPQETVDGMRELYFRIREPLLLEGGLVQCLD